MFGSHLSIAGGLYNALLEAQRLHFDCVQIFTKNQRQWHAAPLAPEQIDLWQQHRKQTGIIPAASHASYLINLATPPAPARRRAIALFRDELERCAALAIPNLVIHPGSHLGAGEEQGMRLIAQAIDQVHKELPGLSILTCLEITAGQGSAIGYRFEHLRRIIDQVRQPERLAICIDTAHLFAAGYDLTSAPGCQGTLEELDAVLGLKLVKVVHVNDSKAPRASRVDRHAHIGKGLIAPAAFSVILRHPDLRELPMILETPKEKAPDGRDWDTINLAALRRLARERGRKSSKRSRPR